MSQVQVTPQINTEYKALTQEQINSFRQQGYISIGNMLDNALVNTLRQEYDQLFAAAQHDGSFRNLAIDDTDDLGRKNNAPTQMLQIMQMCERSLEFRRLLYHTDLLDIAEDLIGPNIQLFHDQALFKPAHQGGSVFWHQDNAYWRCRPANLVSCWLTLDDVDVSNGAMHVLPGSHLQAVDHDRSQETSALLDLGNQVNTASANIVDLPAGGVMFHHCQTLHYTPPNTTTRQRRAFAIHYMPPGTRSGHTGEYLEVSFERPMLRLRH